MNIFLPIDFNSLPGAQNGKIDLSNYYIDYALEGKSPTNGMSITFYDEHWLPNSNDIICFDATLQEKMDTKTWLAELKGQIYTSVEKPDRKYFSSFIGAQTKRLADDVSQSVEQKIGTDPSKNKLSGVSCFLLAHGSPFPNFPSIVGMDAMELHNFFQFTDFPKPKLENGKYPGNTLLVRGGGNKAKSQ